jgi:murein DD-endopeptidase MepM/ murein hydrolase activator NlpD
MRLTVAIMLVGTLASACAARTRSNPTPRARAEEVVTPTAAPVVETKAIEAPAQDATEPLDGVVHVVQPGQTLWRIARAYDVPLDQLAVANGIDDASRVAVGTPIFIRGARATLDVAAYPAPLPGSAARRPVSPETVGDYLWPVTGGAFMRPFGEPRRHHIHAGIDIRGSLGQDILAARDGVVAFGGGTKTGYGKMVVLDHGNGIQTLYAHAVEVLVHEGDNVRRGQPIAHLGRTGNATTEHCHFELRLDNKAVDPMPYVLGTAEAHR